MGKGGASKGSMLRTQSALHCLPCRGPLHTSDCYHTPGALLTSLPASVAYTAHLYHFLLNKCGPASSYSNIPLGPPHNQGKDNTHTLATTAGLPLIVKSSLRVWQAGEAGTQDQGDASLPPGLDERRAEDRVWQGLQAEALKAQGIQAPGKAPGDARWPPAQV